MIRGENIRALADEWLSSTTRNSEATRETYNNAISAFIRADVALDNDCLAQFDLFLFNTKTTRFNRIYSRATRNIYITALDQFLAWLEAKNHDISRIRAKAALRLARGNQKREPYIYRKPDPRIPQIITYYDDMALPAAYQSPQQHQLRMEILRNRAFVHTLLATGARVGEIVLLTRKQIADGALSETDIRSEKTGELDIIFFDTAAQNAIRAYCAERTDNSEYLFVSHRKPTGNGITRNTAFQIVKRAAIELKLSGNTSPHSFRHWLAEDMINNEVPLEAVQKIMRHADIKTTEKVYARRSVTTVRKEINEYRDRKNKKINS